MPWYIRGRAFFIGMLAVIITDAYTQEKNQPVILSWYGLFVFVVVAILLTIITHRPGDP